MICVGLYPSKHLVNNRKYCFYINWFCNMSIHTCFKCLLFIFFKCIGGHGNDWDIGFFIILQGVRRCRLQSSIPGSDKRLNL